MSDTELKELYIEAASIARFTPKELREYEESVKAYRDIVNAVKTARIEGHEEGHEEGLQEGIAKGLEEGERKKQTEIARNLKEMGLDLEAIAKATGLSIEKIESL